MGKTSQTRVAKEVADTQLNIFKTIEQGRAAHVKSQIEASEKETKAAIATTKGVATAAAEEVKVRQGFLKTIEAGRQQFVTSQIKAAETEAKGVVGAAKKIAPAIQAGTTKFDSAAFWARQGRAATDAAKVTETETKRVVSAVENSASAASRATSKVTSTLIRDTKSGTALTKAELAKVLPELEKTIGAAAVARLVGSTSKVVEAEATKVGGFTSKILNDLRRLFLQNNFLFRQLGQRAAGDLGFTAVGVGKLALNFQQLAAASGGAAAELGGVAGSAAGALGALGPLGIAVGVITAGLVALTAASIAAAAGLFFVAKSVSDTEQHFDDLSRQTGLSTDNLQTLDIVARQSGSTLDKLVGSIGQLQRKLIDASEGGTSRFSIGLRKLGVDLEDPNRALNQLIDLLIKIPAGTTRTGAAMQIFGRGGREVAGVIDQIEQSVGNADGALDRLKKQFIDSGIHINKDGTQTAGRFHDELIKIEAQFESIKRIVGEEALPTVLKAATDFSNWIARNRTEIAFWAKEIEHITELLASLSVQLIDLVNRQFVIPITIAVELAGSGTAKGVLKQLLFGPLGASIPLPFDVEQPTPEQSFARRTFTQDRQAQEAAASAAKRVRDAFAPHSRGGGKGEDPAQTARRLAEIALRETLRGFDAEHQALERQLNLNLIARDRYTQDAVNLELKRRQATIAGLQKELEEAEKIRKPGQRAIKTAEIRSRIKEEEQRTATEIQKITDESAAEQLRVGQSLAQSQLRIIENQTERLKSRIRNYADFRIITEEQAAKFEEQHTLRVFNARERILRRELREAGVNVEKRTEAQNKLNELEEERKSFVEENGRRIEAAIRSDAEHVIQFAAQIRDAFQRAQDVRLEAGEMNLEPLRNSLLTRHQLWDAELQFEITREERRHDRAVQGFKDEADLARIRIKNEQELARVLAGIRAQEAAEAESHQARLRQLATQAAEQRRQELLRVADDLSSIAGDIFDAIGKSSDEFWKSLKQSASNFARQLRDELFRGFLEKLITGQAQGAEGLIGMIVNPLLRATGPNAAVADNTKATQANTAAVNALTGAMGGTPSIEGGLSGVLQLIPGLFGGTRQHGGPADVGKVYRIHDNEFFRPNVSGRIYNLDQMSQVLSKAGGETRTIVALGDDAVGEAMESHRLTPQGRRAAIVRGRWNRKTGGLQFA